MIFSLQTLIEKNIKQGSMQELLIGNRTLPKFSVDKVRESRVVVTGATPPSNNRNLWARNFPMVSARVIGKCISFSYEHVLSEGKNYFRILPA